MILPKLSPTFTLKIKKINQKIFKILICLLLVLVFTVIKPKEQAEQALAANPLIGWASSLLSGLVTDIALEQGATFANKEAEKDFTEKVVQKVWNSYSSEIVKLKPTKISTVKWAFNAPKWLKMIVVDAVADAIEETKGKSKEKEKYMSEFGGGSASGAGAGRKFGPSEDLPTYEFKELTPSDPYYKTDLVIRVIPPGENTGSKTTEAYNYFVKYGKINVTPRAYEQKNTVQICISTNCVQTTVSKPFLTFYFSSDYKVCSKASDTTFYEYSEIASSLCFSRVLNNMLPAWNAYKEVLSERGHTVLEFEDVLVLDLPRVVLDLPDNVNIEQLQELPTINSFYDDEVIEFDIPESLKPQFDLLDLNADFEWDLVNDYIVEQGDNFYQVNYTIDYKPVTNNYYDITTEQQDEINEIVGSPDKPPSKDNDTNVGALDRSLIAYVKNAYEYGTSVLKTATDGLKSLATGAKDITALFGVFFSWLPKEMVVLMSSGLGIMIGLRLFRK